MFSITSTHFLNNDSTDKTHVFNDPRVSTNLMALSAVVMGVGGFAELY